MSINGAPRTPLRLKHVRLDLSKMLRKLYNHTDIMPCNISQTT
jgi:hypothetical protein